MPLSRAFSRASATACSISSMPETSPADGASAKAIVPIPLKRSYTRSRPLSSASSTADPYRRSAISVLVWKKASGEMRKRSFSPATQSSSSIVAEPASRSVSPSRVVSATPPVRVHSMPVTPWSASASSGARKSPSLVTTRAWT